MWLRSVYLKTLRDHRTGTLAWGLGPGLLMTATLTQFDQLVGSPEQRDALVAVAEQFSWYETPIGITKPGGFATFRLGPMLAILPSVWALLAASGQLRGEEERGALEVVLAAPISRMRVMLEKLAALGTALLAMAAVMGTLVWLAGVAANAEYGAPEAYVFALNVALTAGVYGSIALLASQLVGERSAAAGITGAILALSFLLHSTGKISPDMKWVGYASPLYYAGLTKPLVPEVGVSPVGMLVLAAIITACASTAARLFARRDLGFAFSIVPARAVSAVAVGAPPGRAFTFGGEWSLRSLFLRSLRTSAGAAVWWAVSAGAYGAWMTSVGQQLQTNITEMAQGSPVLSAVFARLLAGEQATALFLSMLMYTFIPLVLSAYAISQVGRWAADEEEGRTEMLLASPVSRARVIVARFAALGTTLLGITLVTGGAVGVAATIADLPIAAGNLLAASVAVIPPIMCVACLGALLTGWLRAGAVSALLTTYVVGAFILVFMGPIFNWPRALIRLSVYDWYGTPLVDGWSWGPMLALLAVAGTLLATATYGFQRKDLAR